MKIWLTSIDESTSTHLSEIEAYKYLCYFEVSVWVETILNSYDHDEETVAEIKETIRLVQAGEYKLAFLSCAEGLGPKCTVTEVELKDMEFDFSEFDNYLLELKSLEEDIQEEKNRAILH